VVKKDKREIENGRGEGEERREMVMKRVRWKFEHRIAKYCIRY